MKSIFKLPTKEQPVKLGIVSFFLDRIEFDKGIYKLENISNINFNSRISSTNFISSRYLTFLITGINEKDGEIHKINLVSPNSQKKTNAWITKNDVDDYSMMYNFIAKSTFTGRLLLYINYLNTKGYFSYANCEFYSNGNIFRNGKLLANLDVEFTKGTVMWGSSWSGINSSSENPFEFAIISNTEYGRIRIFGFELGLKLKFETYDNHDIFSVLMRYFQKNKKYPISASID